MKKYFEKIVILLILLLVTMGHYTHTLSATSIMYVGIYTNIYMVFRARKFKPLAFMFVFWLSFIINLIPYYEDGFDISGGRNQFDIPELYDQTLFNHVFFLLSIALFFSTIKEKVYLKDHFRYTKNLFGYTVTLLFMIMIAFWGQSGENVFATGRYGVGDNQSSTINEYFIVLVPIALIFSGNIKMLKNGVYFVVAFYLLKDLSFGGRNALLQNGLLLFLIFDSPKIKYWKVILAGSIPVYFMMVFGAVRNSPMVLFSHSISDILLLPFQNKNSFLLSLDTQDDVFYASVRFLGLLDFGVLQQADRLKVFVCNVLAIVMPYKFLPEYTNLARYEAVAYSAGGGGLISAYWYFFLGLPGLLFIAWYICFVIRKAIYTTNMYFLIYALIFLASYPRWFAYNQIIIFKLCSFGALYFIVLKIANNIFRVSIKSKSLFVK